MAEGWEERAADWLAWVRTPGQDVYWTYRDAFFALLPPPTGRALDVGCGEGRVTRDLSERGYRMTGRDASPTLVAAASARDPSVDYVVGDAHHLPFADEGFDLVVAYNALMDVEDIPGAVLEAARVLTGSGHPCVCVAHPFADAGEWGEDGRFVATRPYLQGGPFQASAERDGLRTEFDGFAHSLEHTPKRCRTPGSSSNPPASRLATHAGRSSRCSSCCAAASARRRAGAVPARRRGEGLSGTCG